MPSIEEIKARLAGLNRRTNKPKDLWKPTALHEIRMVRNKHSEDPFIQLYFHYDIGEASVLCPKMNFDQECEICDACDKLKSWKDDEGNDKQEVVRKEDWEMFKKIQPKARVFVAMVERGKEAAGAKYWSITPNQADTILGFCADSDRVEMANAAANPLDVLLGDDGFDLKVKFIPKGDPENKTSFGQVKIEPKTRNSPFSKDKKQASEIRDSVKNIREVYIPLEAAEVSKLWQKFVGSAAPEAKTDVGNEVVRSAKPNSGENAKNVGTRNIDDALEDMIAKGN
ncbi:MAG: hypothetical protein ACYDHY_07850 [Acidiferrobacterales bacterium]